MSNELEIGKDLGSMRKELDVNNQLVLKEFQIIRREADLIKKSFNELRDALDDHLKKKHKD